MGLTSKASFEGIDMTTEMMSVSRGSHKGRTVINALAPVMGT